MPYLNSSQRSMLEKAVVTARKISENGAINALRAMAVHHHEPYGNMSSEQRTLRNRLRNKGRLLGDILADNATQQIENITSELAYEYWHKMLFAKFLEVNALLMHPDGVAVSLQECEELAPAENFVDKWHAASVYASKMLPAIFRPDDPLMAAEFAAEDRIKLETILESIPDDIFTADDSLGWVYQFWQSEAKDAINKSGDKIDGKRLPAVTQLFTEPYMVHFLIDNSIGAWWVSRNPGVTPPVEFKYLRFFEDGTPAAGKFEGWPDKTKEVTSLDPCMGSGHFIVAQFEVFVKLRMYEEGLTAEEAAKAVISENLHGLELDPRCTQIAAFNLALAAWKFVGNYFLLPEMNLACSGLAPQGKKEEWIKLAGNDEQLKQGMEYLYETFQMAPTLGSLLEPNRYEGSLDFYNYENLLPLLDKAIEFEQRNYHADEFEMGITARGIAFAGKLLSKKYVLQITNVPYLTHVKQSIQLVKYCKLYYPDSKNDLATVFLQRILKSAINAGTVCTVIPQNWLFLTTYRKLREKLLSTNSWGMITRLGSGAFNEISGEVVKAILLEMNAGIPMPNDRLAILDVSEFKLPLEKAKALNFVTIKTEKQLDQLRNPDARVMSYDLTEKELLGKYATYNKGLCTGDDPQFRRYIWEIPKISADWEFLQSSTKCDSEYDGYDSILFWQNGNGNFIKYVNERLGGSTGAWIRGKEAWGKKGILIRCMGANPLSIYTGKFFDSNCVAIIPKNDKYFRNLYVLMRSQEYKKDLRVFNQKMNIGDDTFVKIPIDFESYTSLSNSLYPDGIPDPKSDNLTQWLFHGHPAKAESPLQVSVARFLGYRWPAESDEKMELADEARELIKGIKQFDNLSDDDGIVCIPPVNGELAAAERIREYLSKMFGSQWGHNTLEDLLKKENAKSSTLETWLREEFFEQHYKLFNNRPFIWQIWDGRKDGFSVLVNYHKLTKENLQKLIYTYLGDWIRQCEMKVKNGESGADGLLLAAQKLKEKLELILKGENPYDIFVRWKKLEEQPIGWDPDINDGVRLNIRPFIQAEVLRKKPNIKWGVDRGKNPPGSPWGEVRDNDRHLSLKEKLEAIEKNLMEGK